jgi:ABC-type uncharacterized transport system substrate-binding protein
LSGRLGRGRNSRQSQSRPGGNATGFTNIDFGMSAKWLELLKEFAPQTTRALVLRDATEPSGIGHWGALQSMAPSLGLELTPGGVRDPGEIERGVKTLASKPNGALIVTASAPTAVHRDRIIALAAQYRLPAVYETNRASLRAKTSLSICEGMARTPTSFPNLHEARSAQMWTPFSVVAR